MFKVQFLKDERLILKLFANQAAVAIQNALRLDDVKKRAAALDLLQKTSGKISASLDLGQILEFIVTGAVQLIGVDSGAIRLVDEAGQSVVRSYEFPEGLEQSQPRLSENTMTRTIIDTGKLIVVPDTEQDGRVSRVTVEDRGIKALIGLPLRVRGKNVIGVLYLNATERREFHLEEQNFLLTLADQAAIAVENARLFEQMTRQLGALHRIHQIIGAIGIEAADPMPFVLEETAKLFAAKYGSFSTVDPDAKSYISQAIWNNGKVLTGDQIPQDERTLRYDQGIVGYVVREGKPYRTGDAPKDSFYVPRHESVASEMAVPLKGRDDQIIGVLNLESTTPNAFDDAAQSLCAELASVAAVAIEKDHLFETQQRLNSELEGLHKAITGQTPQSVMVQALEGACAILGEGTSANIYLYDEKQGFSEGQAHGPLVDLLRVPPRPHGTGMHVVETGEPYYVDDAHNPSKVGPALRSDVLDQGVKSFAALPLKWQNRILGVLFISIQKPTSFSQETRRMLERFAGQTAIAIENARLYTELSLRMKQLEVLPKIYERIIAVDIEDLDSLLDLLYSISCEVMDLSDAQVQFAFYDASKNEVTFPLAVERNNGELIDRVRWGDRELKFRREGEEAAVPAFQPRSGGSRFGLTEYIIHTRMTSFIPTKFWETANALRVGEQKVRVLPAFGRLDRPTHSWLAVPMIVQGRVIGIISIQSLEQERAFAQEQADLLTIVANQAAVAIENARLLGRETKRARDLATLSRIGVELTSELELLDELLGTIAESANQVLQADFSTLFLYDPDQRVFVSGVRRGRISSPPSMPGDSGFAAQIVEKGAAEFVEDVATDPRINPTLIKEKSVGSFAGVPLKCREGIVGVLYVNFREHHRFSTDEREIIGLLANQAAVAIENARLYASMNELRDDLLRAERLVVQTRWAATYIHRVNNLVGTIPIRVAQIKERLATDSSTLETLRPYLNGIVDDARRVSPMVDDWNRLIAEEQDKKESLDIADALARVARRVRLESPVKIRLEEHYPDEPVIIEAVVWQILDVLYNLLKNAAQVMENGGTLSLTVRSPIETDGKMIEIRAHNTGPKIAESELSKMFALGRSRKKEGSGYGLWSARNAIQKDHGGSLTVHNDENDLPNGVTWLVELPVSQQAGDLMEVFNA